MKPQTERSLGQYLAVRERSQGEIQKYLERRGVEEKEISSLVSRWQEVGLIDNTRFTSSVVRGYLNKGKGPLFIRKKLIEAGIDREQIGEVIANIPMADLTQAMEKRLTRMSRKLAGLPPKLKRQKGISLLLASGFLLELSSRFIDDWMQKE